MTVYGQAFKVQSVEKALSRSPDKTLKQIAAKLGVGYSTLHINFSWSWWGEADYLKLYSASFFLKSFENYAVWL